MKGRSKDVIYTLDGLYKVEGPIQQRAWENSIDSIVIREKFTLEFLDAWLLYSKSIVGKREIHLRNSSNLHSHVTQMVNLVDLWL